MSGHAFVRPGQVAPHLPAPDNCMVCGLPEREHEHVSAELAARRTAAAAVVADFQTVTSEYATGGVVNPDWLAWAMRLAQAAQQLLTLPAEAGWAAARARDASQLAQIRLVLASFDWETDDGQYALEQIDDILRGAS